MFYQTCVFRGFKDLFLYKPIILKRLMSFDRVSTATRREEINGVRFITLNNPKSRNALSLLAINELIDHLSVSDADDGVRCVVIQAEGPVFSSGHNLKEFEVGQHSSEHHHRVFSACSQLMVRVVECPLPVIAVVNGLAAAAGCQLVAQCDIALCTPHSSFSTPGANFGLFCSTPGIAVARSVGRKMALKMLFTGLPISADEAFQCGLVSKVVAAEHLDKEVQVVTDAIQAKSRSVISLGKKFFYKQIETDLYTAYRLGEEVMVSNLSMRDGQEGIKSFIEKRKPVWRHTSEGHHDG